MSVRTLTTTAIVLLVGILLPVQSLRADAPHFLGLGDLPGGSFSSSAWGISADGRVVVGQSATATGGESFRWTRETGMLSLSDLPGGANLGIAFAASADGSVIVGSSSSANSGPNRVEAFRWTEQTGMVGLGDLPGLWFNSQAFGVSGDGSVIVGMAAPPPTGGVAYRWTAETGMVSIGDLPGGSELSFASGISLDGSVIVGVGESAPVTSEAFRWTATEGFQALGDLPGGAFSSSAVAVSADGRVVVGNGSVGNDPGTLVPEASRWTEETGMVGLGELPGAAFHQRRALGVSSDGSIVIGEAQGPAALEAFVWDAQHGMRSLYDVLTQDLGLDLSGWQLAAARGISADGRTIVGGGVNADGHGEAFLAHIPEPGTAVMLLIGGALAARRRA